MINVDMEVDAIAEVICGSQGTETTGNGVKAVKGENFD
jgi:hypothetical protein